MKKIRTKTSSDQKLVKRCEKETGRRCSDPEWRDFNDLAQYIPGPNTAILLVDMHLEPGDRKAVYIHDSNDEQVDMVGMEYKGFTVIIPWEAGLKFVCYGPCRVAEIVATGDSSST
ncbi:hypothetical protein CDEST_09247 [Colletotrichum destructivum]|uniref:Uncharacterized protein n=1 Tax=Colletotrichum destructivum TaxID=34406 RepID=A0AAX4IN80_9PEZI|nr:hypothetical protein CDEST_09247 [Colletotrichum destructivum]